jgi:predicted nucleic acid-binding protein
MIILDTNVLSALMLSSPDTRVLNWLDEQAPESIWTTAVTVFEIRLGIELLAASRRRAQLEQSFSEMLADELAGRVLPFDEEAAAAASSIAARRQRKGTTVDLRDTQIAGIATVRRAAVATRNVRHFQGVEIDIINPWQSH